VSEIYLVTRLPKLLRLEIRVSSLSKVLLISHFQKFWLYTALLSGRNHGPEEVPSFLPESLSSGSLPQTVSLCLCLCLSHALPVGRCVP